MNEQGTLGGRFTDAQVILFTADVERASQFYRGLGFVEIFRVPLQGAPIHVDLALDGYRIGFAAISSSRADHGLEPATTGQRATVTLWTEDVVASYESLVRAGVTGLSTPRVWLGNLRIAWVEDPDGHPIQLVESIKRE